MKRTYSIELLILSVLGCVYFALHAPILPTTGYSPPTLDLRPIASLLSDTSVRPIGLEHERLAGAILPIRIGLQRYGHIPMWNSYLSSGVPLANNAFNYFFNPFHSLPVLILGGVTGSKMAIFIALLIAAYSMWTLGFAVGLGAIARVTVGLLYMLNGSIAAKFGAGHFQLACSLAWPPLVLAALWWTLHSPKRIAPVAVGISFALLFYAGNIYYVLHTTICCLVVIALHVIERNQGRWHFRRDRLQRAVLAGVFAFGLTALQFFPIWQTRDFVTHEQQEINADGTLMNNYDFGQSITNLIRPWQEWAQNHPTTLFDAVDYAYVGNVGFVLIVLAIAAYIVQRLFLKSRPASSKTYSRTITAALILALLMMLWAGGQVQPFPWLYAHIPLLAEFRFLGRALAISALWWILLAGIALDVLWNMLREYSAVHVTLKRCVHWRLIGASIMATCAWTYLFIYSASNGPDRIAMVLRNVSWWQQLDTLRYTSLPDALRGLIQMLVVIAIVDWLLVVIQNLLQIYLHKQQFHMSYLATHIVQITLLGGITVGILNVMTANTPALQFSNEGVPFDTIYDDIRRADPTAPFPSVSLPFSPFTFGAYEHEVRVWSLNEGWSPAAPPKPTLLMSRFSNFPRWLIAERSVDGTLRDVRVQQFIQSIGYELRACYVTDTTMQLSNCSVRKAGFGLYEFPQALPYAFIVSDPVLTNNPTSLHADQVKPADVLLYQQDSMVIHAADTLTDFYKHYLVVQEANFPGWQVTIDGVAVQPITVPTYFIGEQTLGLIAVPTEKGDHTYALRFDPPGLSTGILVFFGTLILILVYLTYRPKQKSPA